MPQVPLEVDLNFNYELKDSSDKTDQSIESKIILPHAPPIRMSGLKYFIKTELITKSPIMIIKTERTG